MTFYNADLKALFNQLIGSSNAGDTTANDDHMLRHIHSKKRKPQAFARLAPSVLDLRVSPALTPVQACSFGGARCCGPLFRV